MHVNLGGEDPWRVDRLRYVQPRFVARTELNDGQLGTKHIELNGGAKSDDVWKRRRVRHARNADLGLESKEKLGGDEIVNSGAGGNIRAS